MSICLNLGLIFLAAQWFQVAFMLLSLRIAHNEVSLLYVNHN
jgi:hypothetical protein